MVVKDRNKYGILVNAPFQNWITVNKVVGGHASNQYHVNAVAVATAFIRSVECPEECVDARMNKNRLQNRKENRHILKCCVESILLCGNQCIALRGDVEKLEKSVNPGNFLAIVRLLSNHDHVLKNPRLKNATYISPDIQNQIMM